MDILSLTTGPKHHFFGYYGINPWDSAVRRHLALETSFHEHRPAVGDMATVGLVDRQTGVFTPYATTSAFNLQQGSMMHWIDAGYGEEFTYNDWQDDWLVSRAVNPDTRQVRTIRGAIAAVSPTAPLAIGLNFARMAHCRPVVGYANNADPASLSRAPEDDGLWLLDLRSGEPRLLLSIAEVIEASGDPDVQGMLAWFNHVLFNTDGSRLLFFCRTRLAEGHFSSLWTVNPDGSGLQCQISFKNRISHFAWYDEQRVLISTDVLGEMGFVEFADGKGDYRPVGIGILPRDGHACFSPDRRWILTDTSAYWQGDTAVVRTFARDLILYDPRNHVRVSLGTYNADPLFTGDIRCDLHPRWSPDGRLVTFDSVHEGTRQVYSIDVSEIVGP
jgi:hypothetical protein